MIRYLDFQNSFFSFTDEKEILVVFSGIWSFARDLDISSKEFVNLFLEDIKTISETKTVIMPAFNWDFIKNKKYDPLMSKSYQGVISESFRHTLNSQRTMHPINSYVVIGKKSRAFMEIPHEGCSWSPQNTLGWFMKQNVCCISLGLPWGQAFTPIHHAEYLLNVPYRYEKSFSGMLIKGDEEIPTAETLFVRPLNKDIGWDPSKVRDKAFEKQLAKKANLNGCILEMIDCKDLVDISIELLSRNPYAFVSNEDQIKKWVDEEKEIEIQRITND